MGKKYKILFGVLVLIAAITALTLYLQTVNVEVFNPKGIIAEKQRNLIVFSVFLSLIVIVPVFVLLFTFLFKYRETNTKATYTPDWDSNRLYETIWWGIPILIIFTLSVVTWNSSHDLDPFKPLDSTAKPLEIQVVALQWKWLFIYPEQNVATVNYAQIPINRPVTFTITSDAPMNSLWIPQLGGQIYAMSGMSTQLHLMASQMGSYNGSSANISGEGFAGMRFKVNATSQEEFDNWALWARQGQDYLGAASYAMLAQPSQNNWPTTYTPVQSDLYATILSKYMLHTNTHSETEAHGQDGM